MFIESLFQLVYRESLPLLSSSKERERDSLTSRLQYSGRLKFVHGEDFLPPARPRKTPCLQAVYRGGLTAFCSSIERDFLPSTHLQRGTPCLQLVQRESDSLLRLIYREILPVSFVRLFYTGTLYSPLFYRETPFCLKVVYEEKNSYYTRLQRNFPALESPSYLQLVCIETPCAQCLSIWRLLAFCSSIEVTLCFQLVYRRTFFLQLVYGRDSLTLARLQNRFSAFIWPIKRERETPSCLQLVYRGDFFLPSARLQRRLLSAFTSSTQGTSFSTARKYF